MKFAAVDVGSNAVRLLFSNVLETPSREIVFKKVSLIRVPLRLGEDAFSDKYITKNKEDKLVYTMIAFKNLIAVHDVISYRACATSAMREAINADSIIKRIFVESGIHLEIINGKKEAEIIYANHTAEKMKDQQTYLYIDVGGGSTELTLFHKGNAVHSNSFNIGTIRLLQNGVSKQTWNDMKDWLNKITANITRLGGIGSGGNINKIINMTKKKDDRQISFQKLKEIQAHLNTFNYHERVTILGLNPDRADVIIPATEIFLFIMREARIDKLQVPQIGLSDGIVHLLYQDFLNQNKTSEITAEFD